MRSVLFLVLTSLIFVKAANAEFILPVYVALTPVASKEADVENWQLPLAKPQKIDGVWRFDKMKDLSGHLKSNTYLIQTKDLYSEISTFYQTWASQDSIETLYRCKARACGSSNQWANGYFKDRRLNGVQSKQVYWALKSGDQYMAMYLVERGTGQKLLRVDILTVKDADADKVDKETDKK